MVHMFDNLDQLNSESQKAAADFTEAMMEISVEVQNRTFDENGLCQGMPFVWQTLDPDKILYSSST